MSLKTTPSAILDVKLIEKISEAVSEVTKTAPNIHGSRFGVYVAFTPRGVKVGWNCPNEHETVGSEFPYDSGSRLDLKATYVWIYDKSVDSN